MLQATLTAPATAAAPSLARDEPLECVIKEQIRDEHLKNLGMKRNKSIRKSIAKRLRKREKLKEEDDDERERHDAMDSGGSSSDNKENRTAGSAGDVFADQIPPAAAVVSKVRRRPMGGHPPPVAGHVETRTSIGSQLEGGKRVEVIRVDPRMQTAPLIGEPQPLPAHLIADSPRKMDRLRRSIRQDEGDGPFFATGVGGGRVRL